MVADMALSASSKIVSVVRSRSRDTMQRRIEQYTAVTLSASSPTSAATGASNLASASRREASGDLCTAAMRFHR